MEGYGLFLANLRTEAGLSQDDLGRLVGSNKSAISRLEKGDIKPPFNSNVRRTVIDLAEILCSSVNEVMRYLSLSDIDKNLLTDSELAQLGLHDIPSEPIALASLEKIYSQQLQRLEAKEAEFSAHSPLKLKFSKSQEYTSILQEIRRKLYRLQGLTTPIKTQVLHVAMEEERIVVGNMYGKGMQTLNTPSPSLYTLASQNALNLMQQADVDCFAVDDLITLTQSNAFAGWDRNDILITRLTSPLPTPEDIEALRQEKLPVIQKNFVNSSHYRLAAYVPAFSDRIGLEVTLAPIGFHDYYTLIPFLDEPLLDQDGHKVSIREKYGHTALTYSETGGYCLVPSPVSLQCVIVTSDHQVILMQRSNSVAFYPNHWSASFEETMDAPGLSPKKDVRSGDADFFDCAIRGMEEEFGVPSDAIESIKVLSLNVEYLILAAGVVAVINTHLTAQEIKSHWLVQAPDRNEASKLATVPLDLTSVVDKMFASGILWHPTSRMRLIQLLLHTYGVNDVAKAIKAK